MTTEKMKKVQAYLLGVCMSIDKLANLNNSNTLMWKKIFAEMDLKKFTKFMKMIRDKETCFYVYIPNTKCPPQKKIFDMWDKHGVEIMQNLVLVDDTTGIEFVTPEQYPVVRQMCRRLEQCALKKMAMPKGDRKTNLITGQVAHEDRTAGITHPELTGLLFKNVPLTLKEITTRGGDMAAYHSEFKQSIESSGGTNISDLSGDSVNRTVKMTEVFMNAMGLETDLVTGRE